MKRKIYTVLDNCYTLQSYLGKTVHKFNKKIKEDYYHLTRLASSQGLVSLSANQIGSELNMFVILTPKKLVQGKWKEYKVDSEDYNVYCNSSILKNSTQQVESVEQCSSIPGLKCKIKRSKTILAIWMDEKNDIIEKQLSGFSSLIFQHEIQHIYGRMMFERKICNGDIDPTPEFQKYLSDKDAFEIYKLKQDYKKILEDKPNEEIKLNQKYQMLLQQIKYSIIERALKIK